MLLEPDTRESYWGADNESSSGCPLHGSVELVENSSSCLIICALCYMYICREG